MNKTKALRNALLVASVATAAFGGTDATPTEVDALIASLEGGWIGEATETPMGNMGFATLFEWQPDGSLHSRSSLNGETYIDLRFSKNEEGIWILTEEAGMEGLGVQSYSLRPVGQVGEEGLHRWVYAERPGFLSVDVGVDDESMRLDVRLRGEPHVAFRLDKQPRETWAQMKQLMLTKAQQSPDEGISIHEVVAVRASTVAENDAARDLADPIATSRQAVADQPASAPARLTHAKALGSAIDGSPANGPRYAFEMLESLTTAIELDPSLSEAYHCWWATTSMHPRSPADPSTRRRN